MPDFFESSNNIFAVIMIGIFLAAGVKVWQESRQAKGGDKTEDQGDRP